MTTMPDGFDEPRKVTLSGKPPAPGHEHGSVPTPKRADDGQHEDYWVLSEAERKKGFVRPVRTQYQHTKCKTITNMALAIAETYAREPKFYGLTFCSACGDHLLVSEFVWCDTNGHVTEEVVGS